MKKMELNQMENLEGGVGGFGTGIACGIAGAGITAIVTATTFGVGTFATALAFGAVCGGSIGWGSASGNWW